jgi:Domain of unknown function (DUF4304)
MVTTARDAFKAMLQTEIAPTLRELGLRGSGQNVELPSLNCWVLLNFQKSAWGDRSDAEFTINLTVINRVEWQNL